MKEQFEKWVMVASSGNADLTLNIHGEYDSPETSGFYELYKLARVDISQALTDMAVQLANAESKCRELAAELHSVKSAHQDAVDTIMNTASKGVVIYTEKPIQMSVATPIHDAYLAEVRAQGVEMAMEHMQSSGSLTFGDCYISLNEFAAQLRQEAAQ
ncbi:hypothetical protein VDN48_001639 [Citrobacter braakii]|nr:hypothetical protein [Citrobacter braakii]